MDLRVTCGPPELPSYQVGTKTHIQPNGWLQTLLMRSTLSNQMRQTTTRSRPVTQCWQGSPGEMENACLRSSVMSLSHHTSFSPQFINRENSFKAHRPALPCQGWAVGPAFVALQVTDCGVTHSLSPTSGPFVTLSSGWSSTAGCISECRNNTEKRNYTANVVAGCKCVVLLMNARWISKTGRHSCLVI